MKTVNKTKNSVSENNNGINVNDKYFICHLVYCAIK